MGLSSFSPVDILLCLFTGKWKIADEFKQIINIRYVLSAYLDTRLLCFFRTVVI
jgi:hypothetical protein